MSAYELDKEQMQSSNRELMFLSGSLLITAATTGTRGLLSNDNSPTAKAIKRRIANLSKKIAAENVNVGRLYSYGTAVVVETTNAELSAYGKMMGFSDIIRKIVGNINASLGNNGNINPSIGLFEFVKQMKSSYDDINQRIVDKTSASGNWSANYTFKSGKAEYSGEYSYASGEFKLGEAEAHAGYSATVFRRDENGNLVFDPQFAATAGASATLFTAAGRAGIGNENLGANVAGDVTVGKVGAEVGVSTGLFDKNGNLNPNAHISAKAEAIALEANAKGSVTVLGAEATVKGSLNVGVGAHANVDIGDGKLKVDIGASLGIGASIGFEVSLPKIGAIKDFSTGITKNITNGFKKIFNW